ncbi:membrane domain-containing protein [Cryptosporidium canis]|nr:membrane domain-containing protein [Cryptosporidium canis]
MSQGIIDRYSRAVYRVIDVCTSLVYWSLRATRYFLPLAIALFLLSFAVFSLTWTLYLIFYWYWIPPKSLSFPINFEFQNRYISQFLPESLPSDELSLVDKLANSTAGFARRGTFQEQMYGSFISSNELTRQLLYEQSEASALLNFNNITWMYRHALHRGGPSAKDGQSNQTHTLGQFDQSTGEGFADHLNTGMMAYFSHLGRRGASKVYNFLTLNWYQRRRYYKGIDEGINRIIHEHVDSRFGNRMNSEILGNEIDIIVELFYFPSKYNLNITPFQITLDLIQCLDSDLGSMAHGESNSSTKILASFKKTSTIEYFPQVVLKFKEYISLLPSLLGLQFSPMGLGLESKVSIRLVENFPLQKRHYSFLDSLESHIKLCGARIKMKPALHLSKSNLIFQTKLPFWKEVIRNHPILMGNLISLIVTVLTVSLLLLIVLASGIYLLWKKYSTGIYDSQVSNSFLPTGTVTYTNCTPTSPYNFNNCQDLSSTKNASLSNCEQLLMDYSLTNPSINISGLLPLETRQISHPRNQYIAQSQSFNDRPSEEPLKSEESEIPHSPKSSHSEA